MRRRKRKNIFFSRLFFFVLIILLAGLVKANIHKFREWQQARRLLLSQEEKIQKQKEKKQKLERLLECFQNEDYLNNIVKQKLNLVEPEEKIIYVLPEKEEKEKEETSQPKNFLEQLKQIFKKETSTK